MNLSLANNNALKRDLSVFNLTQFTLKKIFFMKPIYFSILTFLLSFGTIVHAQSPCDAVSVEVIAPQWQTGQYSYFGVRVSISQPYYQNITVSGYIWDGPDDHGYNEDHPYTLTIPAGSLSAETSVDFYQTGPAAEGSANITSVDPCPNSQAQPQWVYQNVSNNITITYNYQLSVIGTDSSLNGNLLVNDGQQNQTVDFGALSLNSSNVLNKDSLSQMLKSKYQRLFLTYGKSVLLRESAFLEAMVSAVKDTSANQYSYVFQALRMFESVADAAKRDSANTGLVDFTVSEGYIVNIFSFIVDEDFYINIHDFKKYLTDRKLTDSNNVGIDYYLGALANDTGTLSMKVITARLTDYFQSTYARWPQGGQCGCCGNYSGSCYYWNSICLAHDMACQRCQWQACLPGCRPTSCSGNTISWYWWLL